MSEARKIEGFEPVETVAERIQVAFWWSKFSLPPGCSTEYDEGYRPTHTSITPLLLLWVLFVPLHRGPDGRGWAM